MYLLQVLDLTTGTPATVATSNNNTTIIIISSISSSTVISTKGISGIRGRNYNNLFLLVVTQEYDYIIDNLLVVFFTSNAREGDTRDWTGDLWICSRMIYHWAGDNTPRDTNYTATCLPSRKLYKLDVPDTQDTAGEARTSS